MNPLPLRQWPIGRPRGERAFEPDPASCLAIVAEPGVVTARNPGIDLLRGLAIVPVEFNHLGLRIPLKQTAVADVLPSWLLVRLNYNDYEAVFVFFVIPGFLIAGNALRRWGRLAHIDARAFYSAVLRFPCARIGVRGGFANLPVAASRQARRLRRSCGDQRRAGGRQNME